MNISLIAIKFLKLSVFLILILTSLCATCANPKSFLVTVTASSTNLDPIHINLDGKKARLEPGETTSFEFNHEAPQDTYNVTVRLFRMDTLLHTTTVNLREDKETSFGPKIMNYILIREGSYNIFTVTHTSD